VRGLLSFALFCFVVAVLLEDGGVAVAFLAGTAAALAAHAFGHVVAQIPRRPARSGAAA